MFISVILGVLLAVILISALIAYFFNKETMRKLLFASLIVSILASSNFIGKGISNTFIKNKYNKGYDHIYNKYTIIQDTRPSQLDYSWAYVNNEESRIENVDLYVENGYKYQLTFLDNLSGLIVNAHCGQYELHSTDFDDIFAEKVNSKKEKLDINISILNYHNYLMYHSIPFTGISKIYTIEIFNDMNSFYFNGGYVLYRNELKYFDSFDFSNKEYVSRYVCDNKTYYCYGKEI